jgi:dihydroflavonol-4-reductase
VKALVTGAAGFVGSAVLRRLIAAGVETRALVRPTSDRRNLAGLACEIVTGDLTDPASFEPALQGCDALFHVAADYRLWVPDPPTIYRTNVDGTRALMLAAAESGVARIVYTSSVATLGLNADASPADEATPSSLADMIGHYKRSKFMAEAEVRRLVSERGLPAVIVNPSAPVGPRDIRPTPTGRMILEAAAGRMPGYVDTGLNIVHVDDVAEGHWLAFERGAIGERYILGAQDMSLRAILEEVARITGRAPPRWRIPHNVVLLVAYAAEAIARVLGGPEPIATLDGVRLAKKHMYFKIDKARRELGYAPRPAAEAIANAVEWFRANGYLGPVAATWVNCGPRSVD